MTRWLTVGMLAATFLLAGAPLGRADDSKKPTETKSGTVTGVVTAKDKNWIEVKADGEEKGRRYTPHWRGGSPDKGGGLDKDMLKAIADTKVGSCVKIEWEFEERPRVVKIDVLKAATDK